MEYESDAKTIRGIYNMDYNERRNRIRSLLMEETSSSIKPDFICKDEYLDDCIQDEVAQTAKNDLSPNLHVIKDRNMEPYGDRRVPRDEYYLSDATEKALMKLQYVVDVTSYYDFQRSEDNDVEELKIHFKSDIPSGHFSIESEDDFSEWEFQVYPHHLEEVDGRVYVTFLVDMV